MIRIFDILLSLIGLSVTLPLLLILTLIALFDTGSPFFKQVRVGLKQKPFTLVKFRTMKPDTASVPTHLVNSSAITPFGNLLRSTKLDELPQMWNVLKGDMSLVGPRPCLFSQEELIAERAERDVFKIRPGITGLAQINKIDMSNPKLLAKTDYKMLISLNIGNYFSYLIKTVLGYGSGDRVRH
ncbi:MAG: sugar transferase [Candidatus Thiodiazotropha sp. (ex Monitilora ramsayi)]|nr:sugar transferase [Candidatus Thiodiazotropha sp. (ex Monitilora ramsayi)]